jgi:hypothetical protein
MVGKIPHVYVVMAGLVAAIHVQDMDAQDKRGHDGGEIGVDR